MNSCRIKTKKNSAKRLGGKKNTIKTRGSLYPRLSPLRVSADRAACVLALTYCCVESALAGGKKRRLLADSGALSPALRARSALNEWERRAQCLLDKPTPIGHSLR